ncbi:hypothetical protein VR010_06505 [Actinomycetaceae bacterium L2_0104]
MKTHSLFVLFSLLSLSVAPFLSQSVEPSSGEDGVEEVEGSTIDVPLFIQDIEESQKNSELLVDPTNGVISGLENFQPSFENIQNETQDGPGTGVYREVRFNSKARNYKGPQFASCKALVNGTRCQISVGKQVTRSINVSLGATRGLVASQLGISSASSTTTTVSCTSPSLKAGQYFRGYAMGDRYKYQVVRKSKSHGIVIKTDTSGWLYAFDPYRSSIACG